MTELPLRVTYRNVVPTPNVSERIRQQAQKLQELCPRLSQIEVAIEVPHRHHMNGRHFHVRILVNVPGEQLVVNRDPSEELRNESLDAAVTDAFRAIRRELNDYLDAKRSGRHNVATDLAALALPKS